MRAARGDVRDVLAASSLFVKRLTPEQARAWRQRSKPLRRRSRKMEEFYRKVYVPLVLEVLERDHLLCRIQAEGCTRKATTAHEILTRGRGGGIRAKGVATLENMVAACRSCNSWASEHPLEGWVRHARP